MTAYSFFTRLFLAFIFMVGASLSPPPALAEDSAALAKRIQARYQKVSSLAADYTRTSSFVALAGLASRQVKGSGHLIWARTLRLRLEQEKPRQELILAAEGQAWWLRPAKKRADVYPLDRFTSGLTPLLQALGGLASLDADFVVSRPSPAQAAGGPEGGLSLLLNPRQRRADLKALVVWFNQDTLLLSGFKIINLVGDVTTYLLQNVKANVPVEAKLFSFDPPRDWRVVDHRPRRPENLKQKP